MRKILLIGAIAAAGLAGCATGPYDSYGYGPGYYDPYYNDGYGAPAFYGPSVGFGYYYFDNEGRRHWRNEDRSDGRRWQGRGDGNMDRGSGFRGENAMGDIRSSHGEMGNEAGMGRVGGGGGRGGGGQQ